MRGEGLRHVRHVLASNPMTLVAALLFAGLVVVAVFGPALAPHDHLRTDVVNRLAPPSPAHWFGTDHLGRDILSRVLVATRLDLMIALSAVLLSFAVGCAVGAVVGWTGGMPDRVVGRLVDVLMAFPLFVLAMALVAALGNEVRNIVYATAIINLPFYIRLARAEINQRRNAGYVQAARLAGAGSGAILFRVLLPNIMPVMVVQMSLNMGWAILNAAGLSFIGLGVRPPTAEWGIMVAQGAPFVVTGQWWVALFPGLALVVTVFTFNLLGDGLRDAIDPRRRT
jgi:peptide/nickel transport system permease protein